MVLDKQGRIVSLADPPFRCGEGETQLPLPPAEEGSNLLDWAYQNGAWVHDPLPPPPDIPPVPEQLEKLKERNEALETALLELADSVFGTD